MAKKKMLRQIIMPFTLIIIFSLVVMTWFSYSTMKSYYLDETKKSLLSKAYLFQPQVIAVLIDTTDNYSTLQNICNRIGDKSGTRITVMLPDGSVVADSDEDPKVMDNHISRPEMSRALKGEIGQSIRYSNTLQRSMMYLTVPLEHHGKIIGALRMSVTVESIKETLDSLMLKIIFAVLAVALLAALISYFISRRISQPIEILKKGAERFAQGNFESKLPVPDSEEIGQLAEAMNFMASELDKRIRIITRQKNEQVVILQSMIEGVVAVDYTEKIIIMNKAAGELFGVDHNDAESKSVYEIIRNPEIQNVIKNTLGDNTQYEGEITLSLDKEKHIRYNSSILKNADGSAIGALLVFNDLTRLRFLENIRQDFVANVSHELRTPITSIKGFVETLIDNGIDNQEETNKFLSIISKQVDRLNIIIEDLLSLSRIEQDSSKGEITFEKTRIIDVINSSIEICEHQAKDKNICVDLKGEMNLEAEINIPLLEQAIINLLDNAIKYSPDNSGIDIELTTDNDFCKIIVADKGTGIEKKHLERLFERFYRVDKARSRELGGTGLGLAIVKHIAYSHKGTISVESEFGKGSTFTLRIPITH